MKEQQKRKIQQFHPEIEDGTDLRRWPPHPSKPPVAKYFTKKNTCHFRIPPLMTKEPSDSEKDKKKNFAKNF